MYSDVIHGIVILEPRLSCQGYEIYDTQGFVDVFDTYIEAACHRHQILASMG